MMMMVVMMIMVVVMIMLLYMSNLTMSRLVTGTGSDANDELDDYEVRNTGNPEPHLRPQSGGYNRGIGVPAVTQPNNTSSWGYSRQQLPQSSSLVANNLLMQKGGTSGPIMGGGVTGLNDYGTEERGTPTATIGQRRPHTANGQRAAGFPTASQPMPSSGYDTAKQAVAQYNDGGEEVSSSLVSIYTSIYLYIYLSIHLSNYTSIYLSID
jgi:hypothetical protein